MPQLGYQFSGWTDNSGNFEEDLTISVTMTCTKQYTATFTPVKYRLAIKTTPESGGEIIMEPPQPKDGYQLGTQVTLTAKPAKGFSFKEWTIADINSSGKIISYVVSSDEVITAIFVEKSSSILGWVWAGLGIVLLATVLLVFVLKKRRT